MNHIAKIQHPMADEVSVGISKYHYCSFPLSVELAFFKNGEWVTDILPEFAPYADGAAGSTLVYGWVPIDVFANFLVRYV